LTIGQIMVFAKLRHCDIKNAVLALWSLKTNAAMDSKEFDNIHEIGILS